MSALVFFFGGFYCSKYHTGGVERHSVGEAKRLVLEWVSSRQTAVKATLTRSSVGFQNFSFCVVVADI